MSNYTEFLEQIDRKAYHEGEYTWEEDGFTVYRSYPWSAPGCHDSCGCLFYLDSEGRLDHVEGDPLSPVNNGKLCMRCLDMPEATNHPDRLKYPMLRVGSKRENNWKRISWDEALDLIVEKARYYRETYGPASIQIARGTGRNIGVASELEAYLGLETPVNNTVFNIAFSCYAPRLNSSRAMMGDYWIADASMGLERRYDDPSWQPPGVIVIWACEPLKSNADGYLGHWLAECVQLGSKVISIDPRLTWWGARADYWIQLRPGTDGALGMAMCNVIIQENLYDAQFVNDWVYGFNEYADFIKDMTPEKAGEICGVDPELIRGAARLFATEGPGTVQWGLPLEQQDTDCCANNQNIIAMMAICNYIDVPGGGLIVRDAFGIAHHVSEDLLPPGYEDFRPDKVKPDAIWGDQREYFWGWENHDPNRVRMMIFQSCNSLANTSPDPARLFDIWDECLEFVVGADPFMNPTIAAHADLMVPIAMSIERDSIRSWWTPIRACAKITTYYEAMDDETFAFEIINRMYPGRYDHLIKNGTDLQFVRLHDSATGENRLQDIVDEVWKDSKAETTETFSLHKTQYHAGERETWDPEIDYEKLKVDLCGYSYDKFNGTYRKFEKGMLRADGNPGFNTTTGRIELYSLTYMGWGQPPLPSYAESASSAVSRPDLAEKYPLVNVSGVRSYEFFHSEHRQLQTMREFHPWPLACVNPHVAEKYGVQEGEWIWIENDRGRFKQVCHIVQGIRDDVITTEAGWWYPEADPERLFNTFDSNSNNVIDLEQVGPYGVGDARKTQLVRIYPVKEGDVTPTEQVLDLGGFEVQRKRREAYQAMWKEKGIENN